MASEIMVGFIGTMGGKMATKVLKAGYKVVCMICTGNRRAINNDNLAGRMCEWTVNRSTAARWRARCCSSR